MLACFAGQLDCIKHLRKYGAKYDEFDKGGSSPIHWAVDGGSVKLLDWMIEDGADVNLKDSKTGVTPLIRCGKNQDLIHLFSKKKSCYCDRKIIVVAMQKQLCTPLHRKY